MRDILLGNKQMKYFVIWGSFVYLGVVRHFATCSTNQLPFIQIFLLILYPTEYNIERRTLLRKRQNLTNGLEN